MPVNSVNKEQWALGLLRTGNGKKERAAWLDYDVGGNHGRPDAMTIGLYAHGVELLPGFGYPPVHFGGWYVPRALWYKRTAAHNTVVVDGKDQTPLLDGPETEPPLDSAQSPKGARARQNHCMGRWLGRQVDRYYWTGVDHDYSDATL